MFFVLLAAIAVPVSGFAQKPTDSLTPNPLFSIGVAAVEITPEEPIRMSGYGSRKTLSEGAAGSLFAKALAFGDGERTCLLVTADLVGIPEWLTRAVAERLEIPLERLAICATHTHSGPQLRGLLEPIFMEDIAPAHRTAINRYSEGLIEKVAEACRAALANRQASRLDWGIGEVGFASNRRVLENGKWTGFGVKADGPVDHSLPVMRVLGDDGSLRALLVNYACHCTTLGGDMHDIHGDWAGEAQRLLELRHPGVTAMIAIGCGADANPNPRGSMEYVRQHGKTVADEVDRVIGETLKPLSEAPSTRLERIVLPLDPLPKRKYWEDLAVSETSTAYFGKRILGHLDRGEVLPTSIDYPIQTWTFGADLAMVFLPGEVVVDYSIQLKKRFDRQRLWVNAYSNAAPSYIASRRLYDEGGYEVEKSMYFYDKPNRLSPDTEELVLDAVLKQLPHVFYSERTLQRMPAPILAEAALSTIEVHSDLEVEMVASEPLVMDPIDLAWGADGRMWVVEMADYPLGLDGKGKAGGRIRVLEDDDGDGIYDRSTVFLDSIGFPTSVLPWRDGALVTAAPDILFARDTDGDGRADEVEPLYTGFVLGNQQHLVNGMQWGLDGWVYLANGDSGGVVRAMDSQRGVNIGGRDLRIRPEDGQVEAVMGRTQFGRNRDGWGNWFGNSNSWPGWHYALDDTYLQRNPHVGYANGRRSLPEEPQAGPVYPLSRTLSRYNDYEKANRFTSASGFMIYEDDALGEAFVGNSFVAESVHNLVSRAVLSPDGTSFISRRAPEEQRSEFLASTDNWFRPTAIRSGPDGALYIADMYRLVIEHPEWVPEDWQRKLDLRDGRDKGRVYRVFRKGWSRDPIPRLHRMDTNNLVAALDTSNRWQRDQVHQLLVWKRPYASIEALRRIATAGRVDKARAQALAILDQLGGLNDETLLAALEDTVAGVRSRAVRLSETRLDQITRVRQRVWALAGDPNPQVRMQVAYALGESKVSESGRVLAAMALSDHSDPLLLSAILSSALPHQYSIAEACKPHLLDLTYRSLLAGLMQTALGSGNQDVLKMTLEGIVASSPSSAQDLRLEAFSEWLGVASKAESSLERLRTAARSPLRAVLDATDALFRIARDRVRDSNASLSIKEVALNVLSFDTTEISNTVESVKDLLNSSEAVELQMGAVDCIESLSGADGVLSLLGDWKGYSPRLRKHIISTMLKRRESTVRLLRELEIKSAMVSAFSITQIAGLRRNADTRISELADRVFGRLQDSDRTRLVEQYRSSLELNGNPEEGKAHFAALCAACHKVGEIGFDVGPDLASLTDKSPASMLIAILDPNRSVEDKYSQYFATTGQGRNLSGILAEETATRLTFVNTGGLKQEVLRQNLSSLESSEASLMPEGFEAGLDSQGLADLIAFLGDLGSDLRIRPDEDRSIGLLATRGIAEGSSIRYDEESGAFEWMAESDSIEWTVYGLKAGYYDIFSDASLAAEYEGRPFTLELNERFVTGFISTTGGSDRFRKRKFGNIEIESNLEVARFKLRHSVADGLLSLRELRLIPVDDGE